MLTQHNRKTACLSPDYTFAIHELGVWSGDETSDNLRACISGIKVSQASALSQATSSLVLYRRAQFPVVTL